jgi:hypothetical protein
MSWSIQVTNFKVKSLSNNANINYGPTYQNSHTTNSTIIGSNFNFGDNCIISSTNITNSSVNDKESQKS